MDFELKMELMFILITMIILLLSLIFYYILEINKKESILIEPIKNIEKEVIIKERTFHDEIDDIINGNF